MMSVQVYDDHDSYYHMNSATGGMQFVDTTERSAVGSEIDPKTRRNLHCDKCYEPGIATKGVKKVSDITNGAWSISDAGTYVVDGVEKLAGNSWLQKEGAQQALNGAGKIGTKVANVAKPIAKIAPGAGVALQHLENRNVKQHTLEANKAIREARGQRGTDCFSKQDYREADVAAQIRFGGQVVSFIPGVGWVASLATGAAAEGAARLVTSEVTACDGVSALEVARQEGGTITTGDVNVTIAGAMKAMGDKKLAKTFRGGEDAAANAVSRKLGQALAAGNMDTVAILDLAETGGIEKLHALEQSGREVVDITAHRNERTNRIEMHAITNDGEMVKIADTRGAGQKCWDWLCGSGGNDGYGVIADAESIAENRFNQHDGGQQTGHGNSSQRLPADALMHAEAAVKGTDWGENLLSQDPYMTEAQLYGKKNPVAERGV